MGMENNAFCIQFCTPYSKTAALRFHQLGQSVLMLDMFQTLKNLRKM